jgi:hypothetical protein
VSEDYNTALVRNFLPSFANARISSSIYVLHSISDVHK